MKLRLKSKESKIWPNKTILWKKKIKKMKLSEKDYKRKIGIKYK